LKAAEQGNAEAQHHVGCCYAIGDGVERDLAKATHWFMKAAAQGFIPAQEWLEDFKKKTEQ
jgi:uncharacterized protein